VTPTRFTALDGMRGICAIIVLLYHAFYFSPLRFFYHGYLSVDVFFILSGFVLMFAFGDKLATRMTFAEFVGARFRRLGPMVIFGTLFGATGFVLTGWYCGIHIDLDAVAVTAIATLFLIPHAVNGAAEAFPINGVMWSLFAEFWVNVGFALLITRLKRFELLAITLAGWAIVAIHTIATGWSNFGWTDGDIVWAIPRAIPSFACGVLLFKFWKVGAFSKLPSINPLVAFAGWLALSCMPFTHWNAIFDIVQIMIVAPFLIAILARYEGETPAWTLWLGKISYPLYATHAVITYAGQRIFPETAGTLISLIVLPLAVAAVLARWYEPAAMAWLGRKMQINSLDYGADKPVLP